MPNKEKDKKMLKVNEVIRREVFARAEKNGSTIVPTTYPDVLRYCLSLTETDNDMVTVTAATKVSKMTLKAQDGSTRKNPFWAIKDKIRKVHSVKAFVCTHYTESVNNAREKQGTAAPDFVASENWGQLVSAALVAHFGKDEVLKMYIPLIINNIKGQSAYLSSYFTNIETGEIINDDEVLPFIPSRDISAIQEHQGLDKIVDYKRYTITNILYIACHKIVFDLVGNTD